MTVDLDKCLVCDATAEVDALLLVGPASSEEGTVVGGICRKHALAPDLPELVRSRIAGTVRAARPQTILPSWCMRVVLR